MWTVYCRFITPPEWVVITALAFFFLSFNLSIVLVIFNFAIMFHKINKPDTEGYPGFCESEICYVSGFTPKSISGDQTPIH